mmetsp:Transcript_37785/g.60648  ORF Transcript_37785/g.60648 Transcript_37785/m.60648 type:complete len:376 (-) Transcript_37785:406-1533(-)
MLASTRRAIASAPSKTIRRSATCRLYIQGRLSLFGASRLCAGTRSVATEQPHRPPNTRAQNCPITGEEVREGTRSMMHFRDSPHSHPLNVPKAWKNPMQNHVWESHEIEERLKSLPTHTPETLSDKIMHFLVKTVLYNGFNRITGFDKENPTARSCEWRLIILESVAGVPGMVAACMRHFRSLRTLKRDYGWIHTLLEEAENERMHLLVCLKMFNAGMFTRTMVAVAQYTMVGFLGLMYIIHPKALHRFVGYLEETASDTYANLIRSVQTPGTHLHRDWSGLRAPSIAVNYWRMEENAMWLDVLKNLFADETNHRDVNHTFATMKSDDPNPFVNKHLEDAAKAWRLPTDVSDSNAKYTSKSRLAEPDNASTAAFR